MGIHNKKTLLLVAESLHILTKSAGVKRRTVASDYFARLPAMKELADKKPVLESILG